MDMEAHVSALLRGIGEDEDRDGLRETPHRFVRALVEMTQGYRQNPKQILKTFPLEGSAGIVAVRAIPYASLCEHHLLPFTGHAAVAYIPHDRIVGLSKIPRLVQCFAQRLQVQERLTSEIADAMADQLQALGVAVVLHGEHSCMRIRGIRCTGNMVTSEMRGVFRSDASARAEVLETLR